MGTVSREVGLDSVGPEVLVRAIAVRDKTELVGGVECTSRPSGETEDDIRVGGQVAESLGDVGRAAGVVSTSKLGEERPAAVGAEEADKGLKHADGVGGASGGASRAVRVKVLVCVKQKERLVARGRVRDGEHVVVLASGPGLRVGPEVSGKHNVL